MPKLCRTISLHHSSADRFNKLMPKAISKDLFNIEENALLKNLKFDL
jgi:hypothetical protein